jgi:uncharacterized protein GlcG (DUF336 family)
MSQWWKCLQVDAAVEGDDEMNAYQELKRFVQICETVATERSIPICVTVLDVHGHPVLLHRQPGAYVLALEMAERKAYTSAAFNCETVALMGAIQPGQAAYTLTSSSSRFVAFGGGTSVTFGSERFGIGISGGPTAVEDMEMLAAAQDRFESPDAKWAARQK